MSLVNAPETTAAGPTTAAGLTPAVDRTSASGPTTASGLTTAVGFTPEETDYSLSTRQARLKWVVVVDSDLPPGRAANAAVCAAAPTVASVPGLLGAHADDAEGVVHPGLPWTGCSVLVADSATLRAIRAKATSRTDTFVADVPAAAQSTRVYSEFITAVGKTRTEDIEYCAVSIVGPRNWSTRPWANLPSCPESDALGAARTGWDLGATTLWSTQEPCAVADGPTASRSSGGAGTGGGREGRCPAGVRGCEGARARGRVRGWRRTCLGPDLGE